MALLVPSQGPEILKYFWTLLEVIRGYSVTQGNMGCGALGPFSGSRNIKILLDFIRSY